MEINRFEDIDREYYERDEKYKQAQNDCWISFVVYVALNLSLIFLISWVSLPVYIALHIVLILALVVRITRPPVGTQSLMKRTENILATLAFGVVVAAMIFTPSLLYALTEMDVIVCLWVMLICNIGLYGLLTSTFGTSVRR